MPRVDKDWLLRKANERFQRGDLAEVDSICRRVLAEDPNHLEANLLYAKALMFGGHPAGALHLLRDFTVRSPNHPRAFAYLSGLYFHRGEFAPAKENGQRAIDLDPDDATAYANFARDLARTGHADEAAAILRLALDTHRTDEEFLRHFGELTTQSKRYFEAIEAYESVLTLQPKDVEVMILIARLAVLAGRFQEAIDMGQRAAATDPSSASAHMVMASGLAELRRDDEAGEQYRIVTELDPNESTAWGAWGVIEQQLGNFDTARTLLEKAVKLRPSNGYAQHMLMRIAKLKPTEKNKLSALKSLAEDTRVSLIDRAYLFYAMGKGWEDLGEYEKAMKAIDAANQHAYAHWREGKRWERERDAIFLRNVVETFTLEKIRELQTEGNPSHLPVFVVGMPRSGTTLVEQIVSSHPLVFGAGELFHWLENIPKLLPNSGKEIDLPTLRASANAYVAHLQEHGPQAARVTDKMPENYAVLGMLAAVFPNARIIHVRRNPVDNCLSIYTTPFGRPPAFTMRKEDIAFAYREYQKVTARWREQLPPEQYIEVRYEDVIADREKEARRLIQFVNLPWDDVCLRPEANTRRVKTASAWQVRQPIYTTSINRAERFAPWIPEFMELADPTVS